MAGLTYDGIPSTEIDSTNFSGTVALFQTGSFATGIRALDTVNTGSITDAQGRLRSTLLGSATTSVFGGWVQTGSAATSAGSVGFAAFGLPTSDTVYYLQLTPRAFVAGGGSVVPFESGTRSTSGVSFVGAASQTYSFIVIGT